MTDTYRANPELWAAAEKWGANTMDMANCILELRSRVELLEATQHAHVDTSQLSEAKQEQIRQELAKRPAHEPTFAELLMPSPRPQPPSLKEQVYDFLNLMLMFIPPGDQREQGETIRKALEALPND